MKKRYVIDCEVYTNYFLLSAMDMSSGEILHFEKDVSAIRSFMKDNLTISFNGLNYDLPIIACAIRGASNQKIKELSDKIITSKLPSSRVCRDNNVQVPPWDHIDLFEVAPGTASLKIYGGRLHQKKLQDLPFAPDTILTESQIEAVKLYCVNDLHTTTALLMALRAELNLRIDIGKQYGMDVRSKSDAQIAESIILHELERRTGKSYTRPDTTADGFWYKNPGFISFKSENLRGVFDNILDTPFHSGGNGAVVMPSFLKTPITIDDRPYQMGIGGLHSMEKSQYIQCKPGMVLVDYDVASYYPSIILQQKIYPEHIGKDFIEVYQNIVTRRLKAKSEGNKTVADTLKIVLNSSFGKFGSKYSKFYSPDLLIQTTITGQLALIMLIERLADAGISTISANTDGIVLYYPKSKTRDVEKITFDWQLETSYALEETQYRAIASRDVNNYLAVKPDMSIKSKGCFAKSSLSKNPDFQIVYRAVAEKLVSGTPIVTTIRASRDIREFVCVRRVQGGAVWRGEKLGKTVRFYYSTEVGSDEAITYLINGNRVPKSNGAKPAINLPEDFPEDINYGIYITESEKVLKEVGYHA